MAMIKQVLLVSALTVSLTGCIVAPFDDGPGYSHSHGMNQGRPDRERPHWNNGANSSGGQHRPDWNGNGPDRPNQRPNWNYDQNRQR